MQNTNFNSGSSGQIISSDEKSPHIFPKSLPTTVIIGLIVADVNFNHENVIKAVKKILQKLENTLENTPATYQFVLPFKRGLEHEILESLLSDPIWERCSPAEVCLIKSPGENIPGYIPLKKDIPFITRKIGDNTKKHGYDQVTDAIIESCTLIILIGEWEPGSQKYNEGSIFRLARHHGTTIVAIDPDEADTYIIPHEDRIFDSYQSLNDYNNEKISRKKYTANIERYIKMINSECHKADLPENMVEPVYNSLLPNFTRTKILARKYMHLYLLSGTSVSILAALAVFTITLQTIFFPENSTLVWLEVAEIILIISFMSCSRYCNFHRKWIDYNFLSERIRSAFFLYVVFITCKKPDTPPHMTLAHRPNDWMVMAFESLMEEVTIPYCRIDIPFEPVKKFLISAWINNRLRYYERESRNSGKKFFSLTIAGETLFILTLILAVVHALGIGHWELYNIEASMILASLTISLPAFAAAIASIRVQREYLRNKERYSHIVRHITSIKNEMEHVKDMNALSSLLEEMNEITLREQQDWRILFRFRNMGAI
ncbi:MAG: hypothetical protein JXQ82_01810 [Methanomicrobiaceae archaeon]|nr:hypothetical protein [Methanomicrobiaceae archaeon]